jgi:phosphoglycerate dehydrogenase-like enzyme
MALHFARGLDFAVRNQARSTWDQSAFDDVSSRVVELQDLTMGILGFGGIGREVARRAHALGMRVIATRRHADRVSPDAEILPATAAGIARVLRDSDVVVVAMPSTAETRASIGAHELSLLKPNAIVINVARGNIIDEPALIDVLRTGRIRGAALDVFEREPLAADSPLWTLPNTLILPHISATTARYWERETALIVENLERYLEGRPMNNVVDKQAGY